MRIVAMGSLAPRVETLDRLDHILHLAGREMLVARKSDDFGRVPIGHGKIALSVTEMGKRRLTIDRHRIVHLGLDALGEAMREQVIALLSEDDVEVIND